MCIRDRRIGERIRAGLTGSRGRASKRPKGGKWPRAIAWQRRGGAQRSLLRLRSCPWSRARRRDARGRLPISCGRARALVKLSPPPRNSDRVGLPASASARLPVPVIQHGRLRASLPVAACL
eukprot:710500-Pyramimonas_sp.AAC.1